mmetsp:Transcript_12295/g.25966  ORF Transcript_12295/g.25966 Transcript_12295/m.25966 type:complete len:210 (-) Transcript_12295:504-1133(-)
MNIPIPPMHPTRTAQCGVSRHSNACCCNRVKNQIIIACGMSKCKWQKSVPLNNRSFSENILDTLKHANIVANLIITIIFVIINKRNTKYIANSLTMSRKKVQNAPQLHPPQSVKYPPDNHGRQAKQKKQGRQRLLPISLRLDHDVRQRLAKRNVFHHLKRYAILEIGSVRHDDLTDDGREEEHAYAQRFLAREREWSVEKEGITFFCGR